MAQLFTDWQIVHEHGIQENEDLWIVQVCLQYKSRLITNQSCFYSLQPHIDNLK